MPKLITHNINGSEEERGSDFTKRNVTQSVHASGYPTGWRKVMSVSLNSSSLSSFGSQYKYSLGASENFAGLRTFQAHMQEYVLAIALMLGQASWAQLYFKPEGLGPQFPSDDYAADQMIGHQCMLRLQITACMEFTHFSFFLVCLCRVSSGPGLGPRAVS